MAFYKFILSRYH